MREYVCDNPECGLLMCERYPEPGDFSRDYCCEDCYIAGQEYEKEQEKSKKRAKRKVRGRK